jgi:perosamine synthetase
MRLHGINKDAWKRYSSEGSWYYEVVSPGYKYNFTDIQASLGLAQLKKVDQMLKLRKEIFGKYNLLFKENPLIKLYRIKTDRESAHHLYPILLDIDNLTISRSEFINKLKELGIGTSVHFIPLYRHPYYRDTFKLTPEMYPVSEFIYERVITLPIWPGMTDIQINRVADAVNSLTGKYRK